MSQSQSIIEAFGLTDANRTNASGCAIYTGFVGGIEYFHLALSCFLRDSNSGLFKENSWSDGVRSVWVSISHKFTLTWCEGDLTLSKAPDAKSFYNELAKCAEFYEEN